jgi:iron complex outermembrane receptor protein
MAGMNDNVQERDSMAKQGGQWSWNLPTALMGAALCATAPLAAAQDSAADAIPEIIVTAQRSAAPASKTPVSMSVLSGAQLEKAFLGTPAEIGARLPGVHMDGAADGLRITLRGVSNNDSTEKGDPSAAFMLDGIYIARPQIQNVSLYDIARIEVLRGPQGTLYGRNATAGVVNVISAAPGKTLEGAASVALGDYASRQASAMINVPLSDALALRAAMAYNKHDSYLHNGQGTPYRLGLDRDDTSARVAARLALGKDAALLLRLEHSSLRNNNDSFVPASNFYSFDAAGMPSWRAGSTEQRLTNAFVPPNAPLAQGASRIRANGVGVELDWDLGPMTLHYLGSHRSYTHAMLANFHYGLTPTFALGVRESFGGRYRQDSHEVRLATPEGGALSAQGGLYWFRERSAVRYSFRDLELLQLPPYYVFPNDPTESVAKALFGQATWRLAPRVRATAGARYSDDAKSRIGSTNFQQGPDFNAATDLRLLNAAAVNTHKTTWRLGAEYDLAPATLLYATASTGYKSGGFNDGCLAGRRELGIDCPAAQAVPESTLVYQPETLTALEAGLKTRFWDGRASLAASVFSYDYKNLQLSGVAIVQGAPRFVTTNAGVAKVTGLEVEGQLSVTAADRISYSLALLDAHYVSYLPDGQTSWAGRDLDRSPKATATLGLEHSFRLPWAQLKAGLFTRTSGAYVISVPSQLRQYRVAARTQSDLTLGYHPDQGGWSVQAYVKNLQNKVGPIAIDSFGMLVPSDPRTAGARLDYRF